MSLWSDRSYLALCARLQSAGMCPRFIEGERVARGFADLGFEEFCMLPSRKMVSLYSGKVNHLPAEDEAFFFLVPTVEEILQELSLRGIACTSVVYVDQRRWMVRASSGGREWVEEDPHFESALARLLLRP